MYLKNAEFNFNLSYGELYQLSVRTVSLVQRDLTEFEKYGINQSVLNELIAKKDEFEYIPYDEVFEQTQMLLTDEKNQLAEDLKTAIREAMLKVGYAYCKNPIVGISFRNNSLTKYSDAELSVRARVTVLLLEQNAQVLSNYGLTEEEITSLNALEKQFTGKLDEKEAAVCNRNTATNFRVIKANELYEFVSNIRNVGRKMWIEKNEALSNDYIIFHSKAKQAEQPGDSPPENGGNQEIPFPQ